MIESGSAVMERPEKSRPASGRWPVAIFSVLAIAIAAAFLGYWYGTVRDGGERTSTTAPTLAIRLGAVAVSWQADIEPDVDGDFTLASGSACSPSENDPLYGSRITVRDGAGVIIGAGPSTVTGFVTNLETPITRHSEEGLRSAVDFVIQGGEATCTLLFDVPVAQFSDFYTIDWPATGLEPHAVAHQELANQGGIVGET